MYSIDFQLFTFFCKLQTLYLTNNQAIVVPANEAKGGGGLYEFSPFPQGLSQRALRSVE